MIITEEAIRAEVALWQARLGLGHWQLVVEVGPIKGGHRAECESWPEYPEATLRFDPVAMTEAKDDLTGTVVHEMAHMFIEEVAAEALELAGLCYRTDGKTRGVTKKRIKRYEERATSSVARAFLHLHHFIQKE